MRRIFYWNLSWKFDPLENSSYGGTHVYFLNVCDYRLLCIYHLFKKILKFTRHKYITLEMELTCHEFAQMWAISSRFLKS